MRVILMPKYREVVFLQSADEWEEFNTHIETQTKYATWIPAAVDYLLQWEEGEGKWADTPPWGGEDCVWEFSPGDDTFYALSVNWSKGYVGLTEARYNDAG